MISSGDNRAFEPKPPPTSGATTADAPLLEPEDLANPSRTMCGVWVEA